MFTNLGGIGQGGMSVQGEGKSSSARPTIPRNRRRPKVAADRYRHDQRPGGLQHSGPFFGTGNIGLAAGKKSIVSGSISPGSGASGFDPGVLTITGDVQFNTNGTYVFDGSLTVPDRLTITGVLDLDAVNDVFGGPDASQSRDYVIADYGNRIGAFDNVNLGPNESLIYTSPPNSGPGQIVLLVPEPVCGFIGLAALLVLRRKPR